MKNRLAVVVVASFVVLGACTTAGGAPATAPNVTTTIVTVTEPPTTTTAVQQVTTTTLERLAEIEAIFQDLEVRRLQAIMDQDEEAFRAVFANEEYADRSMIELELVKVIDVGATRFRIVTVLVDDASCLAVVAEVDASAATAGGGVGDVSDYIVEQRDGSWGFSWVGSGWRCDGPHPLSG